MSDEDLFCPFRDGRDCLDGCSLWIGESDFCTSPCAFAQIGTFFKFENNELTFVSIFGENRRIGKALEAIASHFVPNYKPYNALEDDD